MHVLHAWAAGSPEVCTLHDLTALTLPTDLLSKIHISRVSKFTPKCSGLDHKCFCVIDLHNLLTGSGAETPLDCIDLIERPRQSACK